MIQPISLDIETNTITLTSKELLLAGEETGEKRVELLTISSGEYSNRVIGYIRYGISEGEAYWMVAFADPRLQQYTHVALCKQFESALHWAMSIAYKYIAIEQDNI